MDKAEYLKLDIELRHAIQTGVAFEQQFDTDSGFYANNPQLARILKHIRTGLNCAMVEHGTMIKLLIDKGLVTEAEYFEASEFMLRQEINHLEKKLSDLIGKKVTLR